jgi:hypothetical protein
MILALSMLYRFSPLIAFTAEGSNLGHYFLITSVVALLTRAESIRNCFLVLRIGFRRKKPAIYRFPSKTASSQANNIRPAKALICPWVGARPRLS